MAAMQFWGIEAKGKESTKVKVDAGNVIHLSQACLGELKKGGEPVTLCVKVDDKKLVLGILSSEKNPQLSFDLVFEKDFEISHNWKNGSVHLLGYQSDMGDEDVFSDFSDEEEDVPVPVKENGVAAAPAKTVAAKPSKDNKSKPQVKAEEEDDSDDDEDSDDESDEDMLAMSDDSDDDDEVSVDDEESSEEETPAKVESGGKKRKAVAKTPEPKKAKVAAAAVTPQKTDGKKGGHTATPYPTKKGGKTPTADKSTPSSTPKSGVSCGSCKKTFNSEVAMQSHAKAKHSAK